MSDLWKGYNIDDQDEDWLRVHLREIIRKYGKEVGYSASLDDVVVERRSSSAEGRRAPVTTPYKTGRRNIVEQDIYLGRRKS